MPRRHWISAAGALAAALLFAASAPAAAQYATGQSLRGSIAPQDATQASSAPVTPGSSADSTPTGQPLPVGAIPPLQRLPGETPTTPLGGTGDDINQVSGDEQVEGPPSALVPNQPSTLGCGGVTVFSQDVKVIGPDPSVAASTNLPSCSLPEHQRTVTKRPYRSGS